MENRAIQKCLKRYLILLLPMLFLCPQCLCAETYSFDFTGDLYIWDLSGSYTDDYTGCNVSYVLTQDAKGKLTGYGNASCSIMGIDIDMSFDIKGRVKQKKGLATIKMSMKFKGTAYDGYDTYKFTAKEKITAEIDPDAGLMEGTIKVCIKISGLGSECEVVSYTMEVPLDMDGSSTLEFDVTEDGKKLLGSGTLTLSNGDVYYFSVKGKYNFKKDESGFGLKGDTSSKGCKLKIKIDESSGQITSLKGKVLGQKLER